MKFEIPTRSQDRTRIISADEAIVRSIDLKDNDEVDEGECVVINTVSPKTP